MPESRRLKTAPDPVIKNAEPEKKKNKLSFKEQRELELLETEIAGLETRKKELLEKMNGGISHEQMQQCAVDFRETDEQLDLKTLRWMELQEKT